MTKQLLVGSVAVGGGAPVSIQSMCSTKTDDVAATVAQIKALENAGCELIRVAIPDRAAAEAVDKIKEQISIPLIADIHFNYKFALTCVERGIDA
ncbi:flavodoxin-dependent (E)-4-hydroxy-3-methylbut-2-enyl-diphosphate synthase, partial [Oscillibacter sp.]|uniref:flavodoxin-dependent (E)-4-hydroxy-3-methylbut-2-enyl-diphosphate synthase n=1 Tax=Oscillibacter sp. TaxID=1945593 RepID=UPI0028A5909E